MPGAALCLIQCDVLSNHLRNLGMLRTCFDDSRQTLRVRRCCPRTRWVRRPSSCPSPHSLTPLRARTAFRASACTSPSTANAPLFLKCVCVCFCRWQTGKQASEQGTHTGEPNRKKTQAALSTSRPYGKDAYSLPMIPPYAQSYGQGCFAPVKYAVKYMSQTSPEGHAATWQTSGLHTTRQA